MHMLTPPPLPRSALAISVGADAAASPQVLQHVLQKSLSKQIPHRILLEFAWERSGMQMFHRCLRP